MVYLKFYGAEQEEFSEIYMVKLKPIDIIKVVNKLVRHFKLSPVNIVFDKRRVGYGSYIRYVRYWEPEIHLHPSGASLGLVVHELGHHYQFVKTGKKSKHNKKLMVIIRRINRYCKKMDYWGFDKK